MGALERIFGVRKPVIAMLHLPGLPGRPWHDVAGGARRSSTSWARDLEVLQDAGVDGVLFCNEAGHAVPARRRAGDRRGDGRRRRPASSSVRVPFGVNLLWDAIASLAVARATGARSSARS